MSDTPQGEGWWLASDGKYYAPELAATPPPYSPQPGPEQKSSVSWWQHPAVVVVSLLLCFPIGIVLLWLSRWPTGVKAGVTAAVVLLVVLAGVAGSPSDETEPVAADAGPTTTAPETTTTTAPTTTAAPESTTTTTEPPTTTAPAPTPEELREIGKLAFGVVFEQTRVAAAQAAEKDFAIQSVDRWVFDPATDTVVLEVTSVYSTYEYQDDQSWELMRGLADLWQPDEGAWWQPDFLPNFQVIVSGNSRACPAAFMVQLATFQANRDQWSATCG